MMTRRGAGTAMAGFVDSLEAGEGVSEPAAETSTVGAATGSVFTATGGGAAAATGS